jgi:hypothetical protein
VSFWDDPLSAAMLGGASRRKRWPATRAMETPRQYPSTSDTAATPAIGRERKRGRCQRPAKIT